MRSNAATLPLGLSRERAWLYALDLVILSIGTQLFIRLRLHMDLASHNWDSFRSAGATAGSNNLVDPVRHIAWQSAHGFMPQIFPYPPAVAWFYKPLAAFSPDSGIALNALVVVAACVFSGLIAASTYSLPKYLSILAVLAWGPALDSIQNAQNGAILMLLVFVIARAIKRDDETLLGLAVGALLFKPLIGGAFVVMLLARRQWTALGVSCLLALIWYIASVAATAGDWAWPVPYVHSIASYYGEDFQRNQVAAITLPGLLMRFHAALVVAIGISVLLLVMTVPLLAKCRRLEAVSLTALAAIALSLHSWGYDAGVVLPAVFFAMRNIRQSWSTAVVLAMYGAASLQSLAPIILGFNPLSLVIITTFLVSFVYGWRKLWLMTVNARALLPEDAKSV